MKENEALDHNHKVLNLGLYLKQADFKPCVNLYFMQLPREKRENTNWDMHERFGAQEEKLVGPMRSSEKRTSERRPRMNKPQSSATGILSGKLSLLV